MAFINLEGGGGPVNVAVRIGITLAVLALLYSLVKLVQVRYTFWKWKKQGVVGRTITRRSRSLFADDDTSP